MRSFSLTLNCIAAFLVAGIPILLSVVGAFKEPSCAGCGLDDLTIYFALWMIFGLPLALFLLGLSVFVYFRPEPLAQDQTSDPQSGDIFQNPPHGAQMKEYRGRRVAILPDGTVVAETIVGPKKFQSFEAFRDFLGN